MEKKLGKNQSFAREINYELVVSLLKDQPYSATQLADKLELSNATLSSIVKELLKFGLIKIESSSSIVGYGRKQVFYTINEDYGLLLLVVLSYNTSRIILTDIKERVVGEKELQLDGTKPENLPTIVKEAKALVSEHNDKELKNIVVSVSGLVSDEDKPNNVVLEAFDKEFKDVPSFLTNDGNLFAYAELSKGKLKDIKNAIFIYLSYGIGGSIIVDGKIFKGDNGFSGEIGCLITDNDGEVEYLEDVASVRVLKKKAEDILCKKLSFEDLYKSFYENNDVHSLVLHSASQVGKALKSLINILDIHYVVINGAVTEFKDEYLDRIKRETAKTFRQCEIEFSELGKTGARIGGVSLGVDYILKKSLKKSRE